LEQWKLLPECLKKNANITKLNFSSFKFQKKSKEKLFQKQKKTANCGMKDKECILLSDAIASLFSRVKTLNLSEQIFYSSQKIEILKENHFEGINKIRRRGIKVLSEALKINKSLTKLDLSFVKKRIH